MNDDPHVTLPKLMITPETIEKMRNRIGNVQRLDQLHFDRSFVLSEVVCSLCAARVD